MKWHRAPGIDRDINEMKYVQDRHRCRWCDQLPGQSHLPRALLQTPRRRSQPSSRWLASHSWWKLSSDCIAYNGRHTTRHSPLVFVHGGFVLHKDPTVWALASALCVSLPRCLCITCSRRTKTRLYESWPRLCVTQCNTLIIWKQRSLCNNRRFSDDNGAK